MIIACSTCATHLQLDDAKLPSRPFTVRCPKCQNIINAQPPSSGAGDQSALAGGVSPATEHPRFEQPRVAPLFKVDQPGPDEETAESSSAAAPSDSPEVVRLLASLLNQTVSATEGPRHAARSLLDQRRALVCVTPAHAEAIARMLAGDGYKVFLAEDTTQAVGRMREEHMEVVILDPDFDPVEQGSAFVTREVNVMLPAERRRLFFVHFSSAVRTLDAHAAFLNNVNLVFNPVDLENLPPVLDRAIRDFNELYRSFNSALSVAAL